MIRYYYYVKMGGDYATYITTSHGLLSISIIQLMLTHIATHAIDVYRTRIAVNRNILQLN